MSNGLGSICSVKTSQGGSSSAKRHLRRKNLIRVRPVFPCLLPKQGNSKQPPSPCARTYTDTHADTHTYTLACRHALCCTQYSISQRLRERHHTFMMPTLRKCFHAARRHSTYSHVHTNTHHGSHVLCKLSSQNHHSTMPGTVGSIRASPRAIGIILTWGHPRGNLSALSHSLCELCQVRGLRCPRSVTARRLNPKAPGTATAEVPTLRAPHQTRSSAPWPEAVGEVPGQSRIPQLDSTLPGTSRWLARCHCTGFPWFSTRAHRHASCPS